MTIRAPLAFALAGLALATAAFASDLEPPPEAPEGSDYEAEPADSIESGGVEVLFGAAGRSGAPPRPHAPRALRRRQPGWNAARGRRRSARRRIARGSHARGPLRHGQARAAVGPRSVARRRRGAVEPRGRGPRRERRLPWPCRDGAWWNGGVPWLRYEGLVGRFSRTTLGGGAMTAGALRLGVIGDGGRQRQMSLSAQGATAALEVALDRDGRWRAETAMVRDLGATTVRGRVRGGHPLFRSLAEPSRSGPAQSRRAERGRGARGLAASEAPVVVAVRAGCHRRSRHRRGRAALRGRDTRPPRPRGAAGRARGSRRPRPRAPPSPGWWWAMSAGQGPIVARRAVRGLGSAAAGARSGARGHQHARRVTRGVGCPGRGQPHRLPDAPRRPRVRARVGDGSGGAARAQRAGERTRIEIGLPVAGGTVHAALIHAPSGDSRARPQWALDWTRRGRLKRKHRRRSMRPRRVENANDVSTPIGVERAAAQDRDGINTAIRSGASPRRSHARPREGSFHATAGYAAHAAHAVHRPHRRGDVRAERIPVRSGG